MTDVRGLVCFDVDGTLVRSTTVCVHLAEWRGHAEVMTELERRYDEGSLSNREVAEADALYYEGVTLTDVRGRLETLPVIDGVAETIEWIRSRHWSPVVATVSWKLAADSLRMRYGFDDSWGCEMEESPEGVLLGRVREPIQAEGKVAFARRCAADRGLAMSRVVAVGDGASDIPLFEAAGFSVAVNAEPAARRAADVVLDTGDLRDLIPVLESRLGA